MNRRPKRSVPRTSVRRLPLVLLAITGFPAPAMTLDAQRGAARPPDSLRVPILVYHNIENIAPGRRRPAPDLVMPPEAFAQQMAYLAEQRIPVVSLDAFVDALEGTRTLPSRAVVITFDDGRRNQYEHAVPILRQYGFTATFFPFVHAMDRNRNYFTWAELRELMADGMSVGSHGVLHVRVDRVRGDSLHREVAGSRETLRVRLGPAATTVYAYPFGALSTAGDSAVRAAGYRAGRAYGGGPWNSLADRWRLRTIAMTPNLRRFAEIVNPGANR